ncbi:MAG: beta-phosphoglucomutase family hydrolase [Actinobacteria bacterium]|nr:beta-phosphoglucomutase family hydrolase [Actinomycetota bacterium]
MTDQLTPDRYDAVLFDLDGVITDTAAVHARAWKTMFDEFLRQRAAQHDESDESCKPFTIDGDYKTYVDGKPRYDGVRSFLQARGIELPEGTPDDPPDATTVCGLGNRKNELVNRLLDEEGVAVYDGSVRLIHRLRDDGIALAVVSSSRNCAAVLRSAGLLDLFDARVDGVVAAERGLPGKPAPDTFLSAAADLDADAGRAVVVEDAISGVQAGRAGGFGLVIGVDRGGDPDALREHGADLVVADLAELLA